MGARGYGLTERILNELEARLTILVVASGGYPGVAWMRPSVMAWVKAW